MSAITPLPSNLFRAPSFLVVHGKIYYDHGGFHGALPLGQTLQYKKHGTFTPEYVGDSYAIIHHVAPFGFVRKIFITPERRGFISCGSWHMMEVNYKSFKESPRYN